MVARLLLLLLLLWNFRLVARDTVVGVWLVAKGDVFAANENAATAGVSGARIRAEILQW